MQIHFQIEHLILCEPLRPSPLMFERYCTPSSFSCALKVFLALEVGLVSADLLHWHSYVYRYLSQQIVSLQSLL